MNAVIKACRQTQQSGNALVLLLLVRSWDGAEPPTRDELAHLAHISPRQAERHLLKLEEDGEIAATHGRMGRGVKTRYSLPVSQSKASDKSLSDVSDIRAESLSEKADVNDRLTANKSDTSDRLSEVGTSETSDLRAEKSDTFDNPPAPPNKDQETSSEQNLKPNHRTARKRAVGGETRLPEDFVVTPAMRQWALKEAADVDIERETEAFRDYWRGVPGARGKKLDWPATWRNRMRDLQTRIGAKNGSYRRPPDGRNGAAAAAQPGYNPWGESKRV